MKKRRKVGGPETIAYYRSLLEIYLQGKELSEEVIDYVVKYQNKWLRNIFRHIQHLYYRRRRKISPKTFGWIMEVAPFRGYKLDIRAYQAPSEEVKKTLVFLKEPQGILWLDLSMF